MSEQNGQTEQNNQPEQTGKKKAGKGTIAMIAAFAVLVAVVAVTAILNREAIEERMELQEAGEFLVTIGDETHSVSLGDLLNLSPVEVTSSPRGELRTFTGVPLVRILDFLSIDFSQTRTIVFTSLDGFATALGIEEAVDETNTFIVFEEDGQPLGTREEGGRGPYMVVVALDPFPNRWARYLMEVTLQ
ncbi:MAG: hypothetical protein FWB75_04390 [Oscillospiraceae bacterium]|nr:hypothetical protein [Oscillospiraceae bacterium]